MAVQQESARFCLADSLYALLVVSLTQGTRDLSQFDPSLPENGRVVTVDGIDFKIVRRVTGQMYEIPGVNLYFHDESESEHRNPAEYTLNAILHLSVEATDNPVADDRTMKKLQQLVDIAMLDGGVSITDFTQSPPLFLDRAARWYTNEGPQHRWQDLTNLKVDSYLHVAKNFDLFYRGDTLV